MVRAALRLSDSNQRRIEGKIGKNKVVIYEKFCYYQRKVIFVGDFYGKTKQYGCD